MKATTQPRVNADPSLVLELAQHATLINLMTDGRLAGTHNATTAAPTTGAYARGDFVKNSEPEELGAPGSAYVVLGWVAVVGGDPATFVPVRALTGN